MNEELLVLTLAYVLLTALLLLAVISGRLKWPVKAGLVVIALFFYGCSYLGWKQSQGWPSPTALPDKFLFHYAVIEEPDKQANKEGDIYIWLTDLKNDELDEKPRAFRIDYDQATHGAVEEALKKTKSGQPQLGQPSKRFTKPSDAKRKDALGQKSPLINFTQVPDPALPEK
ncbi:hypothetical protein ACMXYX_06165 [Neptuniibacter sp. QD72_48]|uniref:hypothetical protein n=1 Tax=unclassified Neptuniibacter TaxID=2630693 RepID=UPI0039F55513